MVIRGTLSSKFNGLQLEKENTGEWVMKLHKPSGDYLTIFVTLTRFHFSMHDKVTTPKCWGR